MSRAAPGRLIISTITGPLTGSYFPPGVASICAAPTGSRKKISRSSRPISATSISRAQVPEHAATTVKNARRVLPPRNSTTETDETTMDRRLLVLALGSFAMGTDSFVVAGVLPEIAHYYNVSIGAAGQLTTIYAVTVALLAPMIAALAANVPRKQLLLAGLALFVVANLATAISPTFGWAM